jgi:hypothetical protein
MHEYRVTLQSERKPTRDVHRIETLNALLIKLQGLLFASANYLLPHSSLRGRR